MRETAKAQQAFNDYVRLGAERSLVNLLERYRQRSANGTAVPTLRFKTLADWSRTFNWQARLAEHAETERQAIVKSGIAERQNRINALNERWAALQESVKAWAKEYKNAPGGARTGYYGRRVSVVKVHGEVEIDDRGRSHFMSTGEQVEVEEWVLDAALLKELRELEKQAAIELGQWTERREVSSKLKLESLSDEELELLEQLVRKTTDAR